MSRNPQVKWAQREDKVYLTIVLPDAKDPKVNFDPEGIFTFSATTGADNQLYELKLELHDKINVEESKINISVRNIFCILEKAEKKWWNRLLRGDEKVPHYVKVDWDKWVDEDEDTGPADLDLGGMGGMPGMGGMDFSKLGDMGGMGGMDFSKFGDMGGMSGMGDDAEFDESDDEEQEVKKPAEKAAEEVKAEENASSKVEGDVKAEAAAQSS